MKKTDHWIKRLLAEAEKCKDPLPWQRGAPRKAMIERRRIATDKKLYRSTA